MNCKTEDDVIELGIPLIAKARVLLNEIIKYKMTALPMNSLVVSEVRQ